jgi:UDP-N-acetylmuramoylalanine--D-glutamate ligase
MRFDDLVQKSVLILGFGAEGQATYEFIRRMWPEKPVRIADRRELERLDPAVQAALRGDSAATLSLGPDYLAALATCDVVIKTPGMPARDVRAELDRRGNTRAIITSHSALFLANYPRERIIGITGTKGKSTTTSLIYEILRKGGVDARLAGNIGSPPLPMLKDSSDATYFVHEFSSHQLAEVEHSPHIAVLLNIVPEHLDYYRDFAEYVAAKENITRFQGPDDFLVFSSDYAEPQRIANRTRARLVPISRSQESIEEIMPIEEIPLPGAFNLENALAAAAVARLLEIPAATIRSAIREFRPLPHRLELIGTFRGIRFYDDSIATVPEATIGALDALGSEVSTLILGGYERNLDYTDFGRQLLQRDLENLIFFPTTGVRMWTAIQSQAEPNEKIPKAFFVETMEEAVRLAYSHTNAGRICLLSPASPSFGLFTDYKDRGDSFKASVVKLDK